MGWGFSRAAQAAICFVGLAAVFILLSHALSAPMQRAALLGLPRIVSLNGQTIRIEVADTPETRKTGLSGRADLAPDEGMLFVFPRDGNYAFWMKDMRFSIDILWLSEGGVVVDMAQNISPDTYPQSFTPKTTARYVLELPGGFAGAHEVRIGDIVRL